MSDNETRRPEDWYPGSGPDRAMVRAWYEYGSGEEPAASEDDGADRKKRRRVRTVGLLLLALVLICGAVFAAASTVARMQQLRAQEASAARPAPRQREREQLPAEEQEEPEYDDYRDYFANYYSGTDDVGIPRAELAGGVTLEVREATGGELSLQEIYERISPAVVGVTAWHNGEKTSWGTGVVFTEDGYIVTNTHIIQGCERATVDFLDGSSYEALLVGEDSVSDVAVLKIEDGEYPCAVFGDSGALRVGDLAVAIGNPLGEDYAGTMTDGIISALERSVDNNGHSMTLLQTNAALNEGNSGGPLVNAYGQVVGITNMKIMSMYYSTVEGIGFAIPSESVKRVADQLLAYGVVRGTPTIGITAAPVTAEAMLLYGLPEGVYVASVDERSDAWASGLQVGDIILKVNKEPVTTVAEVNAIKERFSVGDSLTLTIYRDGKTFDVDVGLIDRADVN